MSIADTRFKLSMFDKLTRQKESAENKVKELNFELELLNKSGEGEFDYREKLSTRRLNAAEKLRNTVAALDQLEKDMNGGSTLNPFLNDDIKEKVQDLKDNGLSEINIH